MRGESYICLYQSFNQLINLSGWQGKQNVHCHTVYQGRDVCTDRCL